MITFRKKSLKIIGILLTLVFCIQSNFIRAYATEAGQTTTDAYLNTFSVTPGTMTPEFSPEVTGYMIAVADDVDQVNVVCSPMNASATVTEAKGFKNLQKGNNSAHITIKAPDGTVCTYNFNIIRGGASNGAPSADASSASSTASTAGSSSSFAVGGAAGSGLSLKISNPPAVPVVSTAAETTSTEQNAAQTQEPETAPQEEAVQQTQTESDDTEEAGEETAYDAESEQEVSPEDEDEYEDEDEVDEDFEDLEEYDSETVTGSGGRFQIGGDSIYANYYIRESFDEDAIPEGFVSESYNFEGATVQSAYFEEGDIRLVYAEAEDGNNGRLRLFYEDDKTVLDFVPFEQPYGYVFPVRYQAQIPVPQNYTGSYMPFEQEVVSCYIYTELTDNKLSVPEGMEGKDTLQPGESTADAESVDVSELDELPEFYLFYGMNSDGEENFYLYDWIEETCQRYVERDTSYDLDQSYFKYKDMAHRRFAIMCAVLVLLLISIFIIINLYLKNRELKRDLEDYHSGEEPEEDFDEEAEDEMEDDEESEDGEDFSEEAEDDIEFIDLSEETDDEATGNEEDVYENEEPEYEEPEEFEEPPKPTIGLTLSDFENSLKLDSEEDEEEKNDVEEKITSHIEEISGNPTLNVNDEHPTEFKMINLSRASEPNGIDEDFEFEFIKFDDN